MPNDVCLLATVLTIAQRILAQGRGIIIYLVPSHIAKRGNELFDRIAKNDKAMPTNPMINHPCRKINHPKLQALPLSCSYTERK